MPEIDDFMRAPLSQLAMLVFTFLAWGGTAFAQQPTQTQINAIRQACRADYQSYCASVPTGGPAALACLKENAQSLSGPCRRAVGAISGSAPAKQGQAPAASAPAPAPPTTETAPSASAPAAPGYRGSPPTMSPRREAFLLRRACGPDYRAYCSYVEPGGGRIIECLRENAPSLSRQCRSALMSEMRGR
jgi:hypothetical protein